MMHLAFGIPGGPEWILILLVLVLIFGRRLPEVGRSLGRSIVEFKKGVKNVQDEIDEATNEPDETPRQIGSGAPDLNRSTSTKAESAPPARDAGTAGTE